MANVTCSVCLEPMILECDISATPCLHQFHIICMTHLLKTPLYLVGSKLLFKNANKIGNFNKKFRESDSDAPEEDKNENKESKESWEIDFENQTLETSNKIHLEEGTKKFENIKKINIGKWSEDFLKSSEFAYMKNFYENQLLKPDFVTISSTLEDPISSISNGDHDFKSALYWKQGVKSHAPACQTKASLFQAGHIQAGQMQAGYMQAGQNQAGQNQAGYTKAGPSHLGQVKVVESANDANFSIEEFEKEINQMKFTNKRLNIAAILNILNDKYLKYLSLKIIF